ncbi:MAG: hypothetical protein JRJ38_12635, partial [Deltaproteobacteria bacterium]|nr:hypothetical protein [Deltaproteobacteria bacterium]
IGGALLLTQTSLAGWLFMKEALDKGASFELPQLDRWNNTLKLQCVKTDISTLRYGRFSGFCQGKNK